MCKLLCCFISTVGLKTRRPPTCAQAVWYRCLWKKHSFRAGPCPCNVAAAAATPLQPLIWRFSGQLSQGYSSSEQCFCSQTAVRIHRTINVHEFQPYKKSAPASMNTKCLTLDYGCAPKKYLTQLDRKCEHLMRTPMHARCIPDAYLDAVITFT